MALSDHAKGYLVTLAGVAIITPDTLLIRLAAIEPFALTVTRGAMGGAMILVLSMLWYRRGFVAQLRGLGYWVLAAAALQGVGMILFVAALAHTSVANVLIAFATMPLISALMAWAFLGERIAPVTWAAIFVCLGGLLIVVSGSLGSGRLFGDLLALADAVCLSGFFTVIRRQRARNMIPAMGFGLLASALLAAPFAAFPAISSVQWLWLGLAGLVIVPFASMLLTLGPRYLAAPEVAMLMLLETVIGPFWVWLALGEEPGIRSLIGGAIVIATLFLHALVRLRYAPRQALSAPAPSPDAPRSR
ncbi:MAG TPA: DMT family transporter [Thermohalobaculum sp.]|nr:DMT family transporter [Thermohalobaculum sp.]